MRCRDDERGAILPMTALLVVVVLAISAFAVDLGVQRVAARDVQAVSDLAALDAARKLPTCDTAVLKEAAKKSAARQGVIGDLEPNDLVVQAGRLDSYGEFQVATTNCTAVRVEAKTSVARAFAVGSGDATRSAVATQAPPAVCFSVGTKTLTLNSSGSALGPVLDRILRVDMSAVGYEGLVDLKSLSVPLADLATRLNVGGPGDLVNLHSLSLSSLMLATAQVISSPANGGHTAQAAVLNSLAAQVGSVTVDVARILKLGTGDDAGLNANFNALDLIGAAIVAANGTNTLRVDGLGLTLPLDLVNAASTVQITEPPQIACGRAGVQARTAQVKVNLNTDIATQKLAAAGLDIAQAHLGLTVEVGRGSATLDSIQCATGSTAPAATLTVTTAAATITGYPDSSKAPLRVRLLGAQWAKSGLLGALKPVLDVAFLLTGYPEIAVEANLSTNVGAGGPYSRALTYPAEPGLPSATVSSGSVLKLEATGVKVSLANGGLLGVVSSVLATLTTTLTAGILNPLVTSVVDPLLSGLLNPLLNALGVKLGVTEVSMLGRPQCKGVQLAG